MAISIPHTRHRLDNGLQVLLHPDPTLPVAAVNLWYRVGSKDEDPRATGFAHLFEHLMFQGSRHYPTDYIAAMQELGAEVNGGTTFDRTSYYEVVPANALEAALAMESDRMGWLLDALSDEKLRTQKDVVVNEFRQQYLNRPYGMTWQWLAEAIYPAGHPYSWMTIGKPEHVAAAERDQVEAFFRRWYTPDNAVLCLAGDIDADTALPLVNRWFGEIAPGRSQPTVNGHTNGHAVPALGKPPTEPVVHRDRITLPRLTLAWHTVPGYEPDDAELDVLADVLTRGKSSRLHEALVYRRQIAQGVSSSNWGRRLAGLFTVAVTAKPGVPLETLRDAVDAELQRLLVEPPTEAEMARCWNRREADFVYGLQSVLGKADRLNAYTLAVGDPGYLDADLERYRRITPEDVVRVLRKYLQADRRLEMHLLPAG